SQPAWRQFNKCKHIHSFFRLVNCRLKCRKNDIVQKCQEAGYTTAKNLVKKLAVLGQTTHAQFRPSQNFLAECKPDASQPINSPDLLRLQQQFMGNEVHLLEMLARFTNYTRSKRSTDIVYGQGRRGASDCCATTRSIAIAFDSCAVQHNTHQNNY